MFVSGLHEQRDICSNSMQVDLGSLAGLLICQVHSGVAGE